jgi:autotransporter-associated beta strand protein
MKNPRSRILRCAALVALSTNASAQLTWDPDGDQIDNGGSGLWDLSSLSWDDDASAPNVAWANGSDAVFGDSGANDVINIADGGVTVGDLTRVGTNILQLKSLNDNLGRITIAPGGAAWDTGGGEIEFLNDLVNDTPLSISSGDTLTINGGGVFDTGEKPNGADWVATGAVLDITAATTVRGNAQSIGTFDTINLADGSIYVHERNTNQGYANKWSITGMVRFASRWDRLMTVNGDITGTGTLEVRGGGNNVVVTLNGAANSYSGGTIIDSAARISTLIVSSDAELGASPSSVDPNNIILRNGGALKTTGFTLDSNRGITLENGGTIVLNSNALNYGGVITGDGGLNIGYSISADGNTFVPSGANDYTGGTNIHQGSITLGANETLPSDTFVTIGGTGTSRLILNGKTQTVSGLATAGNNTRQVVNSLSAGPSAGTLILDIPGGEELIFGSAFGVNSENDNGNFNLEKIGEGSQQLGNVQIAGTVTVDSGALQIGNAAGTCTVGAASVTGGSLGFLETTKAASVEVSSAGEASVLFSVSNWEGVAQTDWTQLDIINDLTISSGSGSFTITIDDANLSGFMDTTQSFEVVTIGGIMGASSSDFVVDDSLFTLGTGTWSVEVVGLDVVLSYTSNASGYATWASTFTGLTDTTFALDFDKGGLDTGVEYVVGGDPSDGSDDAELAPTVEDIDSNLVFTFRRSDLANGDTNTTIIVEYGSDLMGWNPAVNGTDGVVITENDDFYGVTPGIDQVIVSLPHALATGDKLFARLRVEQL